MKNKIKLPRFVIAIIKQNPFIVDRCMNRVAPYVTAEGAAKGLDKLNQNPKFRHSLLWGESVGDKERYV